MTDPHKSSMTYIAKFTEGERRRASSPSATEPGSRLNRRR